MMFYLENMRVLKKRLLKRHVPKLDAKTCAEHIKPFLLQFKLFGLFANNVTAGGVKHCSRPAYGICVFWISFFVSCLLYLIINVTLEEYISLKIAIHIAKHLIGCVSLSTDVITAYSLQNYFNKFFDQLDDYDHKVAQIKNKRRDNLWIPWIVMFLIMFFTLLLVIGMIHTQLDNIVFFARVLGVCTIIIQMYSFLEKFLLLYLLLERFKHLNKNIASNVSWDEKREPNTIKISDVIIMHSMLYDAHKTFNDIYRNSFLLSFAHLMTFIVATLSTFQDDRPLIGGSLIALPVMLMLIICIICHYTAEEANNIACVLNKSMTMLVNSGKTTTKISTLTYFLHNCVSFDAAGFFTIDLPLFQSIVAAITTYFIILV